MRRTAFAPALALALASAAAPAFAQADMLTAPRLACVAQSVTRCSAKGKCATQPASAKDRAEILVVDFRLKTARVRRKGAMRPFAEIVSERVEGGERRFVLEEVGSNTRIDVAVSKSGRLTLAIGRDGDGAVAACTAAS